MSDLVIEEPPEPGVLEITNTDGPRGPKGDKGDKGDTGAQGLQGLYDSSYNTTIDPRPLVLTNVSPYSVVPTAGAITWAMASGFNGYKLSGFTRDIGGSLSSTFIGAGFVNGGLIRYPNSASPSVCKDPISGNWLGQRVALCSGTRAGARRGLLKSHVLAIAMPEVAMGIGDTITVDGVQYVCIWPHSSSLQSGNADSIWVSTAA